MADQTEFSSLLFPGRTALHPREVAERLGVTVQHVIDKIEEGELLGFNIGSPQRRHYRIPYEAYLSWLERINSRNSHQ